MPLFNCAFGPGAVLDVRELMERLVLGAPELLRANVSLNSPPAFLVDSKRMRPDQMDLATHRTELVQIGKPSRFRSLFYRAMAFAGLRRNSTGGFGGIIPQPSSGGYSG